MDNCPERVDVADAEAPRPPRIETAVEFWSVMGVETAVEFWSVMGVETAVVLAMRRMQAAVVLTMRRMQAAVVLTMRRMQAVDNCPEKMHEKIHYNYNFLGLVFWTRFSVGLGAVSGCLSGEDERGGRGGTEAAADRDGGGVLVGDGGVDGGGDGGGSSNEKDAGGGGSNNEKDAGGGGANNEKDAGGG